MTDDPRLAVLGQFTPEGQLTPGYGDHYLFLVGRDDAHGILLHLLTAETMGLKFNMFGYDDEPLNDAVVALMANPNCAVQGTLDKSQAGGVHEKKILAPDLANDPDFYNSIVVNESPTRQIAHTKGGVLIAQQIGWEGSTNWSKSGEGTGIDLKLAAGQETAPGYQARDNTLLVSANPVFLSRFTQRLDVEHIQVMVRQRHAKAAPKA